MLCRTILRRASSRRSPGHRQEEGNWNPTRFPHCLTSQTRPHPSPNTHTPSSLWNLTQVKGLREYNLSKNVLYKSDLSKHLITTLKAGTTHYEQLKKKQFLLYSAEKDLKVGDHGYARRQPRAEFEEDELQRAEEDRPCSLCQHYKSQLEQQQQHTARLQREVSPFTGLTT